jgi:cyclopropane fatty-acyl-phospholipid synthase-like methyltransferase
MATNGGFHDAAADIYEQDAQINRFTEACYRKLQALPGWAPQLGKALDYGCGSGNYTVSLAKEGAAVMAVDISERMVAITKQKAAAAGVQERVQLQVLAEDPQDQLKAAGPFDTVLVCNVLHYALDSLDKILAVLASVLSTEGKVYIVEIEDTEASRTGRAQKLRDRQKKLQARGIDNVDFNLISKADMCERAKQPGFTVGQTDSFRYENAWGEGQHVDCYIVVLNA